MFDILVMVQIVVIIIHLYNVIKSEDAESAGGLGLRGLGHLPVIVANAIVLRCFAVFRQTLTLR